MSAVIDTRENCRSSYSFRFVFNLLFYSISAAFFHFNLREHFLPRITFPPLLGFIAISYFDRRLPIIVKEF